MLLNTGTDPDTEAKRLWASLYDHYPAIAQALAAFLTRLPPTWREDLFTRTYLSPAPNGPATPQLPGPETAPYDDMSWEDCPACAEAQDSCCYHKGVNPQLIDLGMPVFTDDAPPSRPDEGEPRSLG
ncbi:hypothetical protein ABZ490_48840 [Streptomyces sp. NPDC005811]|uniref:hypothetical protein n=1 Tax=Streptomyces sp. NPDC005811 TaxID=3154565 RepID=UPI0033D3444F